MVTVNKAATMYSRFRFAPRNTWRRTHAIRNGNIDLNFHSSLAYRLPAFLNVNVRETVATAEPQAEGKAPASSSRDGKRNGVHGQMGLPSILNRSRRSSPFLQKISEMVVSPFLSVRSELNDPDRIEMDDCPVPLIDGQSGGFASSSSVVKSSKLRCRHHINEQWPHQRKVEEDGQHDLEGHGGKFVGNAAAGSSNNLRSWLRDEGNGLNWIHLVSTRGLISLSILPESACSNFIGSRLAIASGPSTEPNVPNVLPRIWSRTWSGTASGPILRSEALNVIQPYRTHVRRHVGGHHHHHDDLDHGKRKAEDEEAGKAGERITRVGLWADVALTVGKGAAGWISGSTAIIADALHSISDIGLSGVTLWSLRAARKPKDKEHPYGHGRFETVGALGVSALLLVTGGGIAWHALEVLQVLLPSVDALTLAWEGAVAAQSQTVGGHAHHHGIDPEHMGVALAAAVASVGVKEGLYWITKAVGDRVGSKLLEANAWHHRSDAISSLIAVAGVGGAMAGLPFLDPVAGLLVSGMIIKASFSIGYQSLQELVDAAVPESVLGPLRQIVLSVKGVQGCHHMRARRMGPFIMCDLHIEVDPWLSVSAAHNIGEAVRRTLRARSPRIGEVLVHIDPSDGRISTLTPAERESVQSKGGGIGSEHDDHTHGDHDEQHHDADHRHHGGHDHYHDHDHDHDHHHHHHDTSSGHTKPHATTLTFEARERKAAGKNRTQMPDMRGDDGGGSGGAAGSTGYEDRILFDGDKKQLEGNMRAPDDDSHSPVCKYRQDGEGEEKWFGLQADVEEKLKRIVQERFPEIKGISHVTCHFLKSGALVRAEVLMDPELKIREAMAIGKKVENEIKAQVQSIHEADIHLELNPHKASR